MPFKTRKQKEVAASRRFLQSTLSISYDGNSKALEHHESSKASKNKLHKDTFTIEKLDYVGRDIIKILLLASIISGAQIVLALLRA